MLGVHIESDQVSLLPARLASPLSEFYTPNGASLARQVQGHK